MRRTDFSQLQGIESTKRAIEICLAGYHDLYILSSKGNGNTTLVNAITNILKGLNLRNKQWVFAYNGNISNREVIDFWDARDGACINQGKVTIILNSCNLGRVMTCETPKIMIDHYFTESSCESSENIVERVTNARNSIKGLLKVEKDCIILLKSATQRMEFNVATIGKIHEVASTIALLDRAIIVRAEHMAEAIQYFIFDKS
jgi:predicted ATPase with chaperone activity